MHLKRANFIFIVQICPLLVYGNVTITSTGTQIIGDTLVLTCTLTSFSSPATWSQDGAIRTTCTSLGCTDYIYGNYTTFTPGSNHMNVTFNPVDSSIDGLWKCKHATLGSDNVTVTAMNAPASSGGTSTSAKEYGKALAILIVCLLVAYFIVVAVRFCAGSTGNKSGNCFLTFCQFIEERLFDCCGCESSQESEDDPGFFKDKVCTLNSLLGFTYLVLYGVIVEVIVLLAVYYGSDKFQEVLVICVGFGMVLVLSVLCLLVVVWMLMKFVNNGASRSPSFIRNGTVTPQDMGKSQKNATFDKRQQPDGDEGPQSTPKDPDARHLTTGRPLPRRPDIASPQTGSFDSVNSPRPNVLAPIENPNILPSIDTLDEQKTDKKPKDKKKKKKKKKDEEQDNLADVQDNNVLT